jgi:hypothetical protein
MKAISAFRHDPWADALSTVWPRKALRLFAVQPPWCFLNAGCFEGNDSRAFVPMDIDNWYIIAAKGDKDSILLQVEAGG